MTEFANKIGSPISTVDVAKELWWFAPDSDTDPTVIKSPLNGVVSSSSAELSLAQGKTYRIVSDVAVYFRLSAASSVAVVGDLYLPANHPICVKAVPWNKLSFIQVSAGGKIQAAEVR